MLIQKKSNKLLQITNNLRKIMKILKKKTNHKTNLSNVLNMKLRNLNNFFQMLTQITNHLNQLLILKKKNQLLPNVQLKSNQMIKMIRTLRIIRNRHHHPHLHLIIIMIKMIRRNHIRNIIQRRIMIMKIPNLILLQKKSSKLLRKKLINIINHLNVSNMN